jgi:hypothetical protein
MTHARAAARRELPIMRIINLTQHAATAEQINAGVVEPRDKAAVNRLLTFDVCPDSEVIRARAEALAAVARESGANAALVGGAPYLMGPLETTLREVGVRPLYAFSQRAGVEEERQPDGSVRKVQVFRHAGWIWA